MSSTAPWAQPDADPIGDIRATFEEWYADHPPAGVETDTTVDPDGAVEERWRVTNDEAATWALRKVRQAQERMESNIDLARRERQKIDEWLDDVNGPLQRTAEHYEALLREYHGRLLHQRLVDAEGDWSKVEGKTLSLPTGKVKARRGPGRYEIADAENVVGMLDLYGHRDVPKVTRSIGATQIGAMLDSGKAVRVGTSIYVEIAHGGGGLMTLADAEQVKSEYPEHRILVQREHGWLVFHRLVGVQFVGEEQITITVQPETRP